MSFLKYELYYAPREQDFFIVDDEFFEWIDRPELGRIRNSPYNPIETDDEHCLVLKLNAY